MMFYFAKQPKSSYGKDFVAISSYAIISKVKLSFFHTKHYTEHSQKGTCVIDFISPLPLSEGITCELAP